MLYSSRVILFKNAKITLNLAFKAHKVQKQCSQSLRFRLNEKFSVQKLTRLTRRTLPCLLLKMFRVN